MKYSKYSVIIIGSGISGLFLANKLAENNNLNDGILVVTKGQLYSGSSALAQGGIVSVIPEINKNDSVELHIKDTIKAGCGLNNLNTVKYVSEQSALAAQELMRFGVEFDLNSSNSLNFTLEGAHSCPRILHSKGDSTGRIIEQSLCDKLAKSNNVDIYNNSVVAELLIDSSSTCKGAIIYNSYANEFEAVYSSNVVIATGGIGQIYKATTNPIESTGDGIALAHNAGAEVENMEFVQFHPTALYCTNKASMPLVSESARGEGAKLVNINGDYFAKHYHHQADLAPRDVVARAIQDQMIQTSSQFVNLDISQIGIEKFKQRFPTITALCEENNVDLSDGLIPVVPAEHYFMGGIKTDICAKTNILNLYAIGECASTGLHGANRLASNSLLECVVFANSLADQILSNLQSPPKKNDIKVRETIEKYIEIDTNHDETIDLDSLFRELKECMSKNVGIKRDINSLSLAINTIKSIQAKLKSASFSFNIKKYELNNALLVALLVAQAAYNRKESIGAHYRQDCANNANLTEGINKNDKILA